MKILASIGVLIIGFYFYTKYNWTPSVLDNQAAEDEQMNKIGFIANYAANTASIPVAMVGEGWATCIRLDTSNPNPYLRNPGATRLNFKMLQPSY